MPFQQRTLTEATQWQDSDCLLVDIFSYSVGIQG